MTLKLMSIFISFVVLMFCVSCNDGLKDQEERSLKYVSRNPLLWNKEVQLNNPTEPCKVIANNLTGTEYVVYENNTSIKFLLDLKIKPSIPGGTYDCRQHYNPSGTELVVIFPKGEHKSIPMQEEIVSPGHSRFFLEKSHHKLSFGPTVRYYYVIKFGNESFRFPNEPNMKFSIKAKKMNINVACYKNVKYDNSGSINDYSVATEVEANVSLYKKKNDTLGLNPLISTKDGSYISFPNMLYDNYFLIGTIDNGGYCFSATPSSSSLSYVKNNSDDVKSIKQYGYKNIYVNGVHQDVNIQLPFVKPYYPFIVNVNLDTCQFANVRIKRIRSLARDIGLNYILSEEKTPMVRVTQNYPKAFFFVPAGEYEVYVNTYPGALGFPGPEDDVSSFFFHNSLYSPEIVINLSYQGG